MRIGSPVVAAIIWVFAVMASSCGPGAGGLDDLPRGTLRIETGGGEVAFDVWIAETGAARRLGLMGVTSLEDGTGMAFVFEGPTDGSFWMKDTLIPLSIAFWDQEGRVVAFLDMEPCRSDPCPLYSPGEDYVGAVEVNRGALAEASVSVGDDVRLTRAEP